MLHLIGHQCYHAPDNNSIPVTSQTHTNIGSLSHLPQWPQTAHFNPLHKPLCGALHFAKWEDYSNLARNTSTSDVVTPFCSVWPLRQSTYKVEAASPEKTSILLPICTGVRVPAGLTLELPNVDVFLHIMAGNAGTTGSSGPFPCFSSKGIVRGERYGDDLVICFWLLSKILWKLVA